MYICACDGLLRYGPWSVGGFTFVITLLTIFKFFAPFSCDCAVAAEGVMASAGGASGACVGALVT